MIFLREEMPFLSQFLKYEILLILSGFVVVVIFKIFNGRINIRQMLRDKQSRAFSSARMQQLLFTFIISLYYIYLTFKNPAVFPEIDGSLLYLLTASSVVYLGGKARSVKWLLKKIF